MPLIFVNDVFIILQEMLDTPSLTNSPTSREMGVLETKILRLRQCPVETVRFCVASDIEMKKCVRMRVSESVFLILSILFIFVAPSVTIIIPVKMGSD